MVEQPRRTIYISSKLLAGLIISSVNAHKFHEKLPAGVVEKAVVIVPGEVTLPSTGEIIKVEMKAEVKVQEGTDDISRQRGASQPNKPDAAVSTSGSKQPKPTKDI